MSEVNGANQNSYLKYLSRTGNFTYPQRQWPNKVQRKSPMMLSTDLRDGNQALPNPMTFEQKLELYNILVSIGFKEIEVGFPYANQGEFDFVRHLVDTPNMIPEGVQIQVITLCTKPALKRAVDALQGCKRAILQTYLPSSDNYRNTILGVSEEEWVECARSMTAYARSLTKDNPSARATEWTYNFAFEDFSNAKVEAVLRCATAIWNEWRPTINQKMMITLPSSMETSSPNVFADQVEYISRNLPSRDTIRLSVHTHNDRGCAIAAAELASLAGADRVEGCLFGHGERAGNMDLVTFAMNMYTQGLETGLNFTRLDSIRAVVEKITQIPVHPRAPYAGDFSVRAFSGGHQDAISKGIRLRTEARIMGQPSLTWQVPYLPFDPLDIGRTLDDVIGINSQSGKSGVRWVLQKILGHEISLQEAQVVSKAVKQRSGEIGRGLAPEEIYEIFIQKRDTTFAEEKGGHSEAGTVDLEGATLLI